MADLMRFSNSLQHSIDVDEWLSAEPYELVSIAHKWFSKMRNCGTDVKELIHDGCPVACIGDAAFAYVNVFKAHVNVGFFLGATLKDPAGLLEGTGKRMRHVKIRPGKEVDEQALGALIEASYTGMKIRLEED